MVKKEQDQQDKKMNKSFLSVTQTTLVVSSSDRQVTALDDP